MEHGDRGYYFDPTANDALASVTRQEQLARHTRQAGGTCSDIYHASPEEILKFQNHHFEPDRLIDNNLLRKLKRRAFEERKKQKGEQLKWQ